MASNYALTADITLDDDTAMEPMQYGESFIDDDPGQEVFYHGPQNPRGEPEPQNVDEWENLPFPMERAAGSHLRYLKDWFFKHHRKVKEYTYMCNELTSLLMEVDPGFTADKKDTVNSMINRVRKIVANLHDKFKLININPAAISDAPDEALFLSNIQQHQQQAWSVVEDCLRQGEEMKSEMAQLRIELDQRRVEVAFYKRKLEECENRHRPGGSTQTQGTEVAELPQVTVVRLERQVAINQALSNSLERELREEQQINQELEVELAETKQQLITTEHNCVKDMAYLRQKARLITPFQDNIEKLETKIMLAEGRPDVFEMNQRIHNIVNAYVASLQAAEAQRVQEMDETIAAYRAQEESLVVVRQEYDMLAVVGAEMKIMIEQMKKAVEEAQIERLNQTIAEAEREVDRWRRLRHSSGLSHIYWDSSGSATSQEGDILNNPFLNDSLLEPEKDAEDIENVISGTPTRTPTPTPSPRIETPASVDTYLRNKFGHFDASGGGPMNEYLRIAYGHPDSSIESWRGRTFDEKAIREMQNTPAVETPEFERSFLYPHEVGAALQTPPMYKRTPPASPSSRTAAVQTPTKEVSFVDPLDVTKGSSSPTPSFALSPETGKAFHADPVAQSTPVKLTPPAASREAPRTPPPPIPAPIQPIQVKPEPPTPAVPAQTAQQPTYSADGRKDSLSSYTSSVEPLSEASSRIAADTISLLSTPRKSPINSPGMNLNPAYRARRSYPPDGRAVPTALMGRSFERTANPYYVAPYFDSSEEMSSFEASMLSTSSANCSSMEVIDNEPAVEEGDPVISKTLLLRSPVRQEPIQVNIDVCPQPLVATEDGERFLCDFTLDMRPAAPEAAATPAPAPAQTPPPRGKLSGPLWDRYFVEYTPPFRPEMSMKKDPDTVKQDRPENYMKWRKFDETLKPRFNPFEGDVGGYPYGEDPVVHWGGREVFDVSVGSEPRVRMQRVAQRGQEDEIRRQTNYLPPEDIQQAGPSNAPQYVPPSPPRTPERRVRLKKPPPRTPEQSFDGSFGLRRLRSPGSWGSLRDSYVPTPEAPGPPVAPEGRIFQDESTLDASYRLSPPNPLPYGGRRARREHGLMLHGEALGGTYLPKRVVYGGYVPKKVYEGVVPASGSEDLSEDFTDDSF